MTMSRGNHPIEREELMAYLDGELSADRAARTVTHMAQCEECQKLAADLRRLSQDLRDWEVDSLNPEMMPSIKAALDACEEDPKNSTGGDNRRRWYDIQTKWRPLAWVFSLIGVGLFVWLSVLMVGRNDNQVFSSIAYSIGGDRDSLSTGRSEGAEGQGGHPQPQQPSYELQLRRGQESDSRSINDGMSSGVLIVRTAKLALTTTAFEEARLGIENILKRHGGYLGDLNFTTPVGLARTLNATLHVPADQLAETIAELRQLGRVESESQSGQNVTAQYVDLEARLANEKNTERRLTDLLRQRTGKLADVLAVETEISRVRGEIERMEAERKNLANQVQFAAVNATISEGYQAQIQMVPPATFIQLRNAAVEGYSTVVEGIVNVAAFILSYGPSILLWGAFVFFPARIVWKRLRATTPH